MKIWIGAGGDTGELSCEEECLDLFHNIILLSREQSLSSDLLCENQRKYYQLC